MNTNGLGSLETALAERKEYFLDAPLHRLTMADTLCVAVTAMERRQAVQHVALNVAKFVNLRRNPELRTDVFGADIVGVDGMGIVLGARILGIRIPERVAGVDLMERILAVCAERGFRPYFLGARPEVLAAAIGNLARRYPALQIAGSTHGYYSDVEEEDVVERIRSAGADCLFVGMSTPRKERFMARHRKALDVPFVMGVGGGIDVVAGVVRRAPLSWQRLGLEWLYRIIQEPRRMWRRYLTTNMTYFYILACAVVRRCIWRDH